MRNDKKYYSMNATIVPFKRIMQLCLKRFNDYT